MIPFMKHTIMINEAQHMGNVCMCISVCVCLYLFEHQERYEKISPTKLTSDGEKEKGWRRGSWGEIINFSFIIC